MAPLGELHERGLQPERCENMTVAILNHGVQNVNVQPLNIFIEHLSMKFFSIELTKLSI